MRLCRSPFLIVASLALLAGCAPGRGLPELPPPTHADYRLGPGDSVRLITVGDEALTGAFRVGDNGTIALPMLGAVPAAGLRPAELGQAIARALVKGGLEHDPSVAVEVTSYRPIFVLGEVNKPGQFAYEPGMTVIAAVALAGGFTYRAVEDYTSVVREKDGARVEGRASRQAALQPGDVVTVFERRF
jgi:polysaccharide export outer membrane protein